MAWASLNSRNPSSASEILKEFLWNNRFICIDSSSVYNKKLIDAGFITIRDIFDSNGNFRGLSRPQHSHLSPTDHYLLFSLANAIPMEWRKQLRINAESLVPSNEHCVNLDGFSLQLEEKKVNIDKIQSTLLYKTLSSKITSKPTAIKKYNEKFNTETFQLNWERIFSLPFKITLDTKLREFQFKILHRICYTNDTEAFQVWIG